MNNSTRWMLPDGVDELLPSQARSLETVRRKILDLFASHGFEKIQPPLIEFTDSLLIGLGEDVAKQSVHLTDQVSGKPMAIRADVSSQAARIDAHSMRVEGVNRLCYVEPVVFSEPKMAGSSRSPLMAGAEVFGCGDSSADIDVILLMLSTLKVAEHSISQRAQNNGSQSDNLELTLDLGHVGVGRLVIELLEKNAVDAKDILEIFDALQRKSIPDLTLLLEQTSLRQEIIDLLLRLPKLSGGIEVLDNVSKELVLLGDSIGQIVAKIKHVAATVSSCFPDVNIYCDLSESRGYSYHTGLVFAVYCDGAGEALANGGRYDGVGKVFGRDREATGFNTDLKVLNRVFGPVVVKSNLPRVAAPPIEDKELWEAMKKLRAAGTCVVSVAKGELKRYSQVLRLVDGKWQVEKN